MGGTYQAGVECSVNLAPGSYELLKTQSGCISGCSNYKCVPAVLGTNGWCNHQPTNAVTNGMIRYPPMSASVMYGVGGA
jgi:hypothetical protein